MKPRIYIDTSVIGGCCDIEFSQWSIQLMEEVRQGLKIAVISDLTEKELEGAPEEVKKVYAALPHKSIEYVSLTEESEKLAQHYLVERVVSSKHLADAQHMAIAAVEQVNVLVSWNFQQIVNLNRIHKFNAVNLKWGYPLLEIRSPREVLREEEV